MTELRPVELRMREISPLLQAVPTPELCGGPARSLGGTHHRLLPLPTSYLMRGKAKSCGLERREYPLPRFSLMEYHLVVIVRSGITGNSKQHGNFVCRRGTACLPDAAARLSISRCRRSRTRAPNCSRPIECSPTGTIYRAGIERASLNRFQHHAGSRANAL